MPRRAGTRPPTFFASTSARIEARRHGHYRTSIRPYPPPTPLMGISCGQVTFPHDDTSCKSLRVERMPRVPLHAKPSPAYGRRYLIRTGHRIASLIHILERKRNPSPSQIVKVIEPEEFIKKTATHRPTPFVGPRRFYGIGRRFGQPAMALLPSSWMDANTC